MAAEQGPGTLEPGQVRAMFDRIAGLYDLMNTVMTAGLHHRWRARAVELAAVGPGSRVLDVATGTGDLAIALRARVGTGRRGHRLRLLRADARPRARAKAPGARFEWADALALPYATDSSTRPRSASARATSPTSRAACARWCASCARGGRVVILEITQPTREPLASFYRAWFDRVVPALGRVAGDADAYSYLPSSVTRFPGPHELAAVMERCRPARDPLRADRRRDHRAPRRRGRP